ncbi:M20/M25/M40 family metallo-hydrolase [Acuticoccus sp. MNP-M23]|uniref:M20 family metallopeptidase n=1 Tax=Acuticoccus sp. MNP-M23 TaxID=3072793 RepID=UPI0028166759|nr:M20/M25/M40 family metallo-hydrolase [Acuticoccus sp. MNP-M23]WMS42918.1 M20/M25/M40 family metallo-hydrolase [Acuticoccus sp. MNP-M23]
MADGVADETMETRALALLRSLVAAQPQGEAAVQAIIAERLKAAGCTVEELTYEPGKVELVGEFASDAVRNAETRTAIVGRLPGAEGKASLMMFAHPDGEPADDTSGWTHPAFEGTVDGGKLYGWGVADDLAGCASAVLAIEEAAKTPGLGEIIFASTPSKRHARGVSALMRKGLTADASLYLHPAESGVGMREIKTVASGQLEFKVTVEGGLPSTTEPGHTAFSHLADNAVDKFVLLHTALKALAADRANRIRHPLIEAEVGRATNLHISTVACGPMKKFSRLNTLLEFGGAIAFPPGETLDEVKAEVEGAIAKAAADDKWLAEHPPVVTWMSGVTGAEVGMDSPLWEVSSAAVERITGQPPHVNPMHTSSDIRNPMVQAGIPCVGLGCLCGDLSQNGRHDEWVDAADFIRMVDVAAAVTTDWCSRPRGA